MAEWVATDLDIERLEDREPGRGRQSHRADVLSYPRVVGTAVTGPFENRGVLLESRYAGGDWPSEMVRLTPLLCDPLDMKPDEYQDTAPFDVKALQPIRTLLEKIALLHHAAASFSAVTPSDQRCGRHYYDVYRLLDHAPTRAALADRPKFELILADAEAISGAHYSGWSERPSAGYAQSPAFDPPPDSDLRSWLQARYRDASELLPATASPSWPSFGRVLQRVQGPLAFALATRVRRHVTLRACPAMWFPCRTPRPSS
jgi:hypothetical protein